MPTGSSTVGSPSPGSSKQASCNDDQSLIFSPHHPPNLKHNRLYLTSERPRPGPLNVVVPTVLVPQCRRQHEAQIVPDSRGTSPAMTMRTGPIKARCYYCGFGGSLKSSGGGSSICGISMLIFDGSIAVPRSIQYVTDPGQKMTMTTRITCNTTHGIAP